MPTAFELLYKDGSPTPLCAVGVVEYRFPVNNFVGLRKDIRAGGFSIPQTRIVEVAICFGI
jgi:hypothetical protein